MLTFLVYLDKNVPFRFILTSFERVKYNKFNNQPYISFISLLFCVSNYTEYKYIKLQLLLRWGRGGGDKSRTVRFGPERGQIGPKTGQIRDFFRFC